MTFTHTTLEAIAPTSPVYGRCGVKVAIVPPIPCSPSIPAGVARFTATHNARQAERTDSA